MNDITAVCKAKNVRKNMGPLFWVSPQKQISLGNKSDALKDFIPNSLSAIENADVFMLLFLVNNNNNKQVQLV